MQAPDASDLDLVHDRLLEGVEDGSPEEAVGLEIVERGELAFDGGDLVFLVGDAGVFGFIGLPLGVELGEIVLGEVNVHLDLGDPQPHQGDEEAGNPDSQFDGIAPAGLFEGLGFGHEVDADGHTLLGGWISVRRLLVPEWSREA